MTTTASISAAKVAPHIIALRPADAQAETIRAVATPVGGDRQQARIETPKALVHPKTALAAQESGTDCDSGCLTQEEELALRDLKRRDAEVRRHEQAHAQAGGAHAGSPQFQYETGPDGRKYAVAGHVSIDVSPVNGDPQATIRKMDTVRRAATAPADPSAQDRAVAAKAQQEKLTAQRELARSDDGDDTAPSQPADTGAPAATGPDTPNHQDGAIAGYARTGAHRVQSLISLVA